MKKPVTSKTYVRSSSRSSSRKKQKKRKVAAPRALLSDLATLREEKAALQARLAAELGRRDEARRAVGPARERAALEDKNYHEQRIGRIVYLQFSCKYSFSDENRPPKGRENQLENVPMTVLAQSPATVYFFRYSDVG